ncbi:hypothetical protein ACQUY5_29695 [Bacillus cereus]|uniref:hypothetical protein n=1 Tax=Bacillus cereus TaxID=1396 RepID=UPI003D16946F
MLTQRGELINELRELDVRNEVLLFVAEVKPALIVDIDYEETELLKTHFPFTPLESELSEVIYANMFFQSEEQKEKFVKENMNGYFIKSRTRLGIELGYPPDACKVFGRNLRLTDVAEKEYFKLFNEKGYANHPWVEERAIELGFNENTTIIDYHGMRFNTPIDKIKESCIWMVDNRPVPENLQTQVMMKKFV